MLTKTAFFALLNDTNNRIGVTAHIAMFEEANGNLSVILKQTGNNNGGIRRVGLSTHKAATTFNAAFAKYNAWLNEWFVAQAEAVEAQIEAAHTEALSKPAAVNHTAARYGVQHRFAAMMVHTGDDTLTRRGADMVAFISDRKADYKRAHPDMLTGGGTIIDQDHFTDFIILGLWK